MAVGPNSYLEVTLPVLWEEQLNKYYSDRPIRRFYIDKVRKPPLVVRDRYLDRRLRESFQGLPGLEALQAKSKHRLSLELSWSRLGRIASPIAVGLAVLVAGLGYSFLMFWYLTFVPDHPDFSRLWTVVIPIGAIVLVVLYLGWFYARTRLYERRAAWLAFKACLYVEKHDYAVSNTASRRVLIRKIEKIARAVERIPFNYRQSTGRSTASRLFYMAGERAAYIRGLNVWVSAPIATTRADLDAELLHMIESLVQGRWAQLRVSPLATNRAQQRTQRIAFVALAGLLIGALVAVNIFSKQLGPVATIISSAIGVALVTVLSRSGLAVETLKQGIGLAPELASKNDDKDKG